MKVIINKKSRRPYPHEDEVTSAVFGPLSILPADQVWLALSTIFQSELAAVFDRGRLDSFRPDRVDFQFWPTWKRLTHMNVPNQEPDLVITVSDRSNTKFVFLIEVKWDSDASRYVEMAADNDELVKVPVQLPLQWAQLEPGLRDQTLHIYLVKKNAKALDEVKLIDKYLPDGLLESLNAQNEVDAAWNEHRFIVGWNHVMYEAAESLSTHREASEALKNWAADVTDFLELLVVNRFRGFGHLSELASDYSPDLPSSDKLFWEGWQAWKSTLFLSQHDYQHHCGASLFWDES